MFVDLFLFVISFGASVACWDVKHSGSLSRRFRQRFGARLAESDREQILEEVTAVMQRINNYDAG